MKNGKGKEMNEIKERSERKVKRRDEERRGRGWTKIRAERKRNDRERKGNGGKDKEG